ncbi:MAG: hypothetical protein ACRD4O_19450 [Bryobacteraceae bacterium]
MDNSFEHYEYRTAGAEALAACFYMPGQSLWVEGGWKCPHCSDLNQEAEVRCHCGFDREELADFRDKRTFSIAKLVIVLTL